VYLAEVGTVISLLSRSREMNRVSYFEVLKEAPVGSSHERIFEVTAKLQLENDQKEIEALRNQVITLQQQVDFEYEIDAERVEANLR